jgi:DNA-binding CsgD family transcriptional regulator
MAVQRHEGALAGESLIPRGFDDQGSSPRREPGVDLRTRHDRSAPDAGDRVAELEGRLRRIAAELRAAGFMNDERPSLEPARDIPQLDELSSRQREILVRLLNAQRVSLIAAELFVSPSTVRNHLTTIFAKFGVHSQAELLAVLRSKP